MRIDLLVQSALFGTSASANALAFARAAIAAGHPIKRVFFYKDAVVIGNRFATAASAIRDDWTALAADAGFELAICITAAGRRGVVEGDSLAEGIAVVGLGQLIETMEESQRLVSF